MTNKAFKDWKETPEARDARNTAGLAAVQHLLKAFPRNKGALTLRQALRLVRSRE
jgi:hypothetical protein